MANPDAFTIVDTLDQQQWLQYVDAHPKGSIFHTPYMVEVFYRTKHHYPFVRAALNPSGDIIALLVAVHIQTLPNPFGNFASRSLFYAEPICCGDDRGVVALQSLFNEHDAYMQHKVLFSEVRPLFDPSTEKAALIHSGYEYQDYLNFLIDLRQSTDTLWRNMKKTCRADIRNCQKMGMTVKDMSNEEGATILHALLQQTYSRAKVPLADMSLFVEALRVLQEHNLIKISIAFYQNRPVAAGVLLMYKKLVYAWYLGSERMKSISPAGYLTWNEIEWGHQNGFERYDFGGAGWPNKHYGVRDFKANFGGTLVHFGRYRKIYSYWKFNLAERGYELLRHFEHLRNRSRSSSQTTI